MLTKRVIGVVLVMFVAALGAWLLRSPVALTPESASGQQARQEAAAPGRPVKWSGQHPEGVVDLGGGTYRIEPVSPTTVNVAALPRGANWENGLYQRWLRGEVDLDENEGGNPAALAAAQAASLQLPYNAGIDLAGTNGLRGPDPLDASFDSIDYTESGGYVPPDPELTAGSEHLIAVINVAFEIYDKEGNSLVGPVDFNQFFASLGGGCASFSFDPNALYDEETDRYMIATDGDGVQYCIGVSQTDDPTGEWNLYAFPTGIGGAFFDYPHAGIGTDAIYMGSNNFGGTVEPRIWAFDKDAMYAGEEAGGVTRNLGSTANTPQPLKMHGFDDGDWPEGPHYFVTGNGQSFSDASTYRMFAWEDPFDANVVTEVGVFNLPAVHGVTVGAPIDAPQAGSAALLQANDPRPLDFEYRLGSGWFTSSVACNPGGGAVDCIQWAEVDLENAEVVQAGVYSSSQDFRIMPDVAVDRCGNFAVGYTKTNTSIFPSVFVAGRETNDPLGELQDEVELKAGEVTYTAFDGSPHRWGDYTGMTIDPDGTTYWYLGEYSKQTGSQEGRWGTWIAATNFTSCLVPDFALNATPEEQAVCIPDDATYTIEIDAFQNYDDPVDLSVTGVPAGASAEFAPETVVPPGSSTLTIDTSGASAGNYTLEVLGIAPTSTHTTTLELDLFAGVPDVPTLISPPDNATAQPTSPTFEWLGGVGSSTYTFELATDPAFTDIVDSASGLTDLTYTTEANLEPTTTYYWRVRSENVCGAGTYSEVFTFTTAAIACEVFVSTDVPKVIGPNAGSSALSNLDIEAFGSVSDVNVVDMRGVHTYVGDLDFNLLSPAGTEIQLLGSVCGSADNFYLSFDDEAEAGAPPCPPIAQDTFYQPAEPLATFDGEEVNGTWTLRIDDNADADGGALAGWGLEVCYSQEEVETGTIAGTVTDVETGDPIPGATVTAEVAGNSYTTATTNDGTYSLEVPVGIYSVTADADGYSSATVLDVVVEVNQTTEVDFALSAEPATAVSVGTVASEESPARGGLALALGVLLLGTGAAWLRRSRR